MARSSLVVRFASAAVLAAALVFGAQAAPGPDGALAEGPCVGASTPFDDEERAFLVALNEYREARGLGRLLPAVTLRRSAQWHADDMAQRNYFAHNDSQGREPSRRAMDCGYPSYIAQNIAAGTHRDTGVSALELFLSSPPHVATLSDPKARYVGIARAFSATSKYSWYWVTDFGAVEDPAGVMATPAAPRAGASADSAVAPLRFTSGWNLVTWTEAETPVGEVFSGLGVAAVYAYDTASGTWRQASRGAPNYVNTLAAVTPGTVYWFVAD